MDNIAKIIGSLLLATIICSFILQGIIVIGTVVVISIFLVGIFKVSIRYMECDTVKKAVDREYTIRMFEIEKRYELAAKHFDSLEQMPESSNQPRGFAHKVQRQFFSGDNDTLG